MGERRRVDGQPGFVLHAYSYRETSLIVEVFTRDHGRVALMARGARRPKSSLRGLLMAFQPLEIGWAGSGEVLTLMKADWIGGQPLLKGRALFVGYYLNELLINLLPREDSHVALYMAYEKVMRALADDIREADLRRFEKVLLQELGYGLTLRVDQSGHPIDPLQQYGYEIETGARRMAAGKTAEITVQGKTLLDMDAEDFTDPVTALQSKQLMRALMHYYLGGKVIETRKILMELQEL